MPLAIEVANVYCVLFLKRLYQIIYRDSKFESKNIPFIVFRVTPKLKIFLLGKKRNFDTVRLMRYLSVTEQHETVEHVEDLQTGLVDGEDDRAVGVCQLVEVGEELKGRGCIQA